MKEIDKDQAMKMIYEALSPFYQIMAVAFIFFGIITALIANELIILVPASMSISVGIILMAFLFHLKPKEKK